MLILWSWSYSWNMKSLSSSIPSTSTERGRSTAGCRSTSPVVCRSATVAEAPCLVSSLLTHDLQDSRRCSPHHVCIAFAPAAMCNLAFRLHRGGVESTSDCQTTPPRRSVRLWQCGWMSAQRCTSVTTAACQADDVCPEAKRKCNGCVDNIYSVTWRQCFF